MAKKKETTSLIEALLEYQELKSIDRNTLIAVMEDSLRNVLSKMFGSDDTFDVIINVEKKGDFEIWRTRHVVADDDFVDEVREVPLSEAQRVDPDIAVGEDFVDAVDFNSFGRRAVINLRQALASKILELQKEHFYHSFVGRVGELVSAEVYQVWKREALLIDDEGNELLMPKSEQIPGDFFRKGENIDVTTFTTNPMLFIQRALSPGKAVAIALSDEDEEIKQAEVYMRPDQVPLAIGKNAANLKLASLLTGYRIEIFRDEEGATGEEDIYLDEFSDEIDEQMIQALKEEGYTTAKSVLREDRATLLAKTELDEDVLDRILEVLRAEFSEEEPSTEDDLTEEAPAESAAEEGEED